MSPIAMEAPVGQRRGFLLRSFAGAPLPWIMPVILVIGVFYLYPVLDVFRLSLTNATLIGENSDYTLDSIRNMVRSPQLPDILWATLIFVGGSVVGQQILGLAVAVVVVRGEKRGLFGTTILRTTALVAWVVPGIAGGIIWQMLFSE
ncbi:MAG: sugar ABC transporter permease, partial [Rhizobiaceae bacterium]|nr:sugar ABC transporter permease [Rhizobiaceae bacterium]